MTEQKFKSEMRRARTMQETSDDPMRSEYWAGYQRGLRRAYHGKKFGTEAEHASWSAAINSLDESRKQRGLGYADGLSCGAITSQIGRPRLFDEMLDKIPVTIEMKNALEKKAESSGLSVPDARRRALEEFLK